MGNTTALGIKSEGVVITIYHDFCAYFVNLYIFELSST